jgi:hypothetical protein
MKYSRIRLLKLFAVAVALGLAACTLMLGPSSGGAEAAATALAQDVTESGAANPQVESVEAAPLEKATAEGDALLFVRFAAASKVGPTVPTVIDDRDVLLHDDGQGGDEVAGDGTHSAVIFLDFNQLADNQERVSQLNNAPPTDADPAGGGESLASPDSVLMPNFDFSRDRRGTASLPKVDFRNVRPGQRVPIFRLGTYRGVDPRKSLVITDIKVVEDPTRTFNPCTKAGTPMGPWTFGHLMREMANQPRTGITPSAFVRKWLDKWMNDQTTANGWTAAKRQRIKQLIIDPWEAASGGPGMPLDLSKAPFRLLAIVNRVDLRGNSVYGGGSAGEGRFVFGVIDMTGRGGPYNGQQSAPCGATPFTVIVEYGIDRTGCAIRDWGKQWYNLRNFVLGSPAYNAALQAITDQFTRANAAPRKPNGSALNQLRTNEIAIANLPPDADWQMREFRLPLGDGHLFEANAKQTPHESLRNTDLTAQYVNADTPAILAGVNVVPDFWLGQPFLTNASDVPPGVFWKDGPNVFIGNRQARHLFSLNTCSACHAGETGTGFTHITPTPFGAPAGLSGFMTGINVADPADGAPTRTFNEFQRRALDLDALVNTPCFFDIRHTFVQAVH